jgi:hypothetical protein
MPIDTSNLMGEIYDTFSKAYAKAKNDQAVMAFEVLGIPMTDGMFRLNATDTAYCPPLAIEHVSDLANMIPHVTDTTVTRGLGTVPGTFELLLDAAMPSGADAMAAVGAAKTSAKSSFDITPHYMDDIPGHVFHPVYSTPPDWYVPTSGGWVTHTSGTAPQGTQGPTPPPKVIAPPVWRVLPIALRPSISQPITAAHPLLTLTAAAPAAAAAPHPVAMAAAPMALKTSMSVTAASPALAKVQPAVTLTRAPQLMLAVNQLQAVTTPQPVASNSLEVTFDHCVVTLTRPWYPDTLMLLRSWYVPDYGKGEISNGSGAHDPGILPLIPTAFVAIRNLKITANWSQQDLTAIQNSAAMGPFSLIGRNFNSVTGTLTCPGMQVIGWFCAAVPQIPPLDDPAKK